MQFLIGDSSEGHLKSPRVTNGFLPITGDRKEIETWEWSRCLSRRDALIHMQFDLLRSPHDLERSNFDFDLSKSSYTFSIRVDEANTMVSKSLLCLFKHGSY